MKTKKEPQKAIYQKILEITCRIVAENPLPERISKWQGRNGESPRQGIDTSFVDAILLIMLPGRNGESPRQGIDTFDFRANHLLFSYL